MGEAKNMSTLEEKTQKTSKKIIVITSSPRAGGNSDRLAEAFMEGARSAGNTVDKLELRTLRIEPCIACDKCWSSDKPCILNDDMDSVYQAIDSNDIVAFAMPLSSRPQNLESRWESGSPKHGGLTGETQTSASISSVLVPEI